MSISGAIDAIVIRRDALEKTTGELILGSPWEQTVARLRCLRGIDTLSAVGLCAEVGEFERFAKPRQLMSYLGLIPIRGHQRRETPPRRDHQDRVSHARRLLVEAAWHYRRAPAKSQALRRRQEGQPAHIIEISWQAQQRLHNVWQQLDTRRGKRRTIVAIAVARELAGFCLGTRQRRLTGDHAHVGEEAAGHLVPGESIRDLSMSSPKSGPRSILDSRALTRKPVLR